MSSALQKSEATATDFPVETLQAIAAYCRREITAMLAGASPAALGEALAPVEPIVALFFREMKLDPTNPDWKERDRFLLSHATAAPALYAVLAYMGALRPDELKTYAKLDSRLQKWPDRRRLPLVESSVQSPGQGLSIACGVALGLQLDRAPHRVYCALGEKEMQWGSVWEAAAAAARLRLSGLTALMDGSSDQANQWKSLGWNVIEAEADAFEPILEAFAGARMEKNRPTVILTRRPDPLKGKLP